LFLIKFFEADVKNFLESITLSRIIRNFNLSDRCFIQTVFILFAIIASLFQKIAQNKLSFQSLRSQPFQDYYFSEKAIFFRKM